MACNTDIFTYFTYRFDNELRMVAGEKNIKRAGGGGDDR
jgi:hypothetical protein